MQPLRSYRSTLRSSSECWRRENRPKSIRDGSRKTGEFSLFFNETDVRIASEFDALSAGVRRRRSLRRMSRGVGDAIASREGFYPQGAEHQAGGDFGSASSRRSMSFMSLKTLTETRKRF